eukprot:2599936-Prorocentrum_lima.AAC.1
MAPNHRPGCAGEPIDHRRGIHRCGSDLQPSKRHQAPDTKGHQAIHRHNDGLLLCENCTAAQLFRASLTSAPSVLIV